MINLRANLFLILMITLSSSNFFATDHNQNVVGMVMERENICKILTNVITNIATNLAIKAASSTYENIKTRSLLVKIGLLDKDPYADIIPELNNYEKQIEKALQEKQLLKSCNGTQEELEKYDDEIEALYKKQKKAQNEIRILLLQRANNLK